MITRGIDPLPPEYTEMIPLPFANLQRNNFRGIPNKLEGFSRSTGKRKRTLTSWISFVKLTLWDMYDTDCQSSHHISHNPWFFVFFQPWKHRKQSKHEFDHAWLWTWAFVDKFLFRLEQKWSVGTVVNLQLVFDFMIRLSWSINLVSIFIVCHLARYWKATCLFR